ncbi:unnamed protein product [Cyprideis torosa]|uniref:Uncharacterized protein n=1 Tax=Cyprideis torosa TaxID=163714 RepID=A0A7R8WFP7_9CRUS|nr:unnamed protein product [Cyprideis torosa]CAG0897279.1 unnamed protein product [Cyprideis torosa]
MLGRDVSELEIRTVIDVFHPREVTVAVWVGVDVVFERYKVVVQITLGEQRGAGVKVVSNCCWDKDTDNYASDVFLNVSTDTSLYMKRAYSEAMSPMLKALGYGRHP